VLSLSSMMGCRLVFSEFEYVEGIPDLHLLFLSCLFQARHGMQKEPKQKWFTQKANVSERGEETAEGESAGRSSSGRSVTNMYDAMH
jgi:hypothetical protein